MIISSQQLIVFFLIVARTAGIMVFAPFFSDKQLFMFAKVALIFWFSSLIIFAIPLPGTTLDFGFAFLAAVFVEFMIGAMIGFSADLIIHGIQLGGALMDNQAGLSVASMLDPTSGQSAAIFERKLRLIAVLIFIIIDGHHMILAILYNSFSALPVGAPVNLDDGGLYVFSFAYQIFKLGVQLSAPILLIVFMVDFGFGMLNKVAEQINVFQLGFQIKPTVSLLIMLAIIPGLIQTIIYMVKLSLEHVLELMVVLQS